VCHVPGNAVVAAHLQKTEEKDRSAEGKKKVIGGQKKKLTVSMAKVLSPADTTEGRLTGTASGIGGITWAASIPSWIGGGTGMFC
jgi:chromosome condensin MukBEF ATPase and DNA-binding subunit MukB